MIRKASILTATLCIVILSLSGCTNTIRSLRMSNDAIPQETRTTIDELSNQVISAISDNDVNKLLSLSGYPILENLDNLTRIVNDVSKVMVEMPIVMDVHCIKFSTISNVAQIVWTDSYYMQIQPFSKEMAVVLSTFQENAITYLLLQVFSYNSTWELVGLSVREYAYNSMNAAMLFTKTRELENEGKTILAILYANLLQQIIQPGIVYANTQEMSEYVVKLQNRVNKEFVFPAILSTSESEYDIVGLQSLVTEKGLSCYIHYLTDLSFDQIDALGIEGTLILENIDILFPGMTDGFDVFMIKAFHELPIDPNQIYPAYTTLYNLQ